MQGNKVTASAQYKRKLNFYQGARNFRKYMLVWLQYGSDVTGGMTSRLGLRNAQNFFLKM